MFRNKGLKNSIILGITLITLLEASFANRMIYTYRGIYQVAVFIPLLMQPFIYNGLLRKAKAFYKLRFSTAVLFTVLLPLLIFITLPNYSYEQGKNKIEQYLGNRNRAIFIHYSFNRDTIPVVYKTKSLLLQSREYYYEVNSKNGIKYFIVNPVNGKVMPLGESYWKN